VKKSTPAADPDGYVAALTGWQLATVKSLRKGTLAASTNLVEVIKWGHIVYYTEGPVLLIRAEEKRVLFGFWRGKRLRKLDERLVASGKYEMATLQLREGDTVSPDTVRRLVREAVRLNRSLGDPTRL
jgi:hypothetical protein